MRNSMFNTLILLVLDSPVVTRRGGCMYMGIKCDTWISIAMYILWTSSLLHGQQVYNT